MSTNIRDGGNTVFRAASAIFASKTIASIFSFALVMMTAWYYGVEGRGEFAAIVFLAAIVHAVWYCSLGQGIISLLNSGTFDVVTAFASISLYAAVVAAVGATASGIVMLCLPETIWTNRICFASALAWCYTVEQNFHSIFIYKTKQNYYNMYFMASRALQLLAVGTAIALDVNLLVSIVVFVLSSIVSCAVVAILAYRLVGGGSIVFQTQGLVRTIVAGATLHIGSMSQSVSLNVGGFLLSIGQPEFVVGVYDLCFRVLSFSVSLSQSWALAVLCVGRERMGLLPPIRAAASVTVICLLMACVYLVLIVPLSIILLKSAGIYHDEMSCLLVASSIPLFFLSIQNMMQPSVILGKRKLLFSLIAVAALFVNALFTTIAQYFLGGIAPFIGIALGSVIYIFCAWIASNVDGDVQQ